MAALNPFDMPQSPSEILSVTLTSTATAYAAGDNVGGKKTIASAVRTAGGACRLRSVTVIDLADQRIVGELIIFNADPSASTSTDNAAQTIHADDVAKVIARIQVPAANYVSIDSKGIAVVNANGHVLKAAASSTSLYAVFVTTGTPTYGAGDKVVIKLGVERD